MSVANSNRDEVFWSAIWWAIAFAAAIVVFFVLSLLIADDPASGLIFGGVTFVLVGTLLVRFGPGPGPNQEVWHDPEALPSMAHSTPEPAAVAPAPAAPVARAPEPVAAVAEPIAPVAAPVTGGVEVETPPPGTGISERVRDAARAAGEAARAMAGDASTPEPVKPAALAAPAEGGADDLKNIKGVGPKLEELLHSLGIYHFSQIAGWGPAEVAWMDSNLEGFFGRVTRDDWVGQAKLLATGGETDFSKRVDEGDV